MSIIKRILEANNYRKYFPGEINKHKQQQNERETTNGNNNLFAESQRTAELSSCRQQIYARDSRRDAGQGELFNQE